MKQILLYCILTMSILYAQTIRVGSENAYKPFAYLNHKSEPSGFDNDVVKVVAKYMQNDKIEFVPVGWNSIFSGLDSAKFDIVANQIAKTKDREEKYLFSQYPYFYAVSGLIVGKDSVAKDIKDLKKSKQHLIMQKLRMYKYKLQIFILKKFLYIFFFAKIHRS